MGDVTIAEPVKTGALEELDKKMQNIAEERLLKKEIDLKELEIRLDRKIEEFKKFVDKTEVQGRSLAQPTSTKTKEEEDVEEINTFLKGTGLKI